jgi:hypothetical protein
VSLVWSCRRLTRTALHARSWPKHLRRLATLLALIVAPQAILAGPVRGGGNGSRRCGETTGRARTVVDVVSLEILPGDVDPEVPPRTFTGTPRTGDELRKALVRQVNRLGACYRWARQSKPELSGSLAVKVEIDPWSIVTHVSAVSQEAGLERLASCVEDVLLHSILEPGCSSTFRRYTSRETVAAVELHFQPVGLAEAYTKPRRPVARAQVAPCPPALCKLPLPPSPRDGVDLGTMTIDAKDPGEGCPEEILKNYDEAVSAWVDGGRKGKRPRKDTCVLPSVVPSCPGVDVRRIGETVMEQTRAYRSCWKLALAGKPGLVGKIMYELGVDPRGGVCSVRPLSGTATLLEEHGLTACLENALRELRFDTSLVHPVIVNASFDLAPGPRRPD